MFLTLFLALPALQNSAIAAFPDDRATSSIPFYFPVDYRILGAQECFFLKQTDEELTWNSSRRISTQPFLLSQVKSLPVVKASHGPFSVQQVLSGRPPEPWRNGLETGAFLNPSWRIRAHMVQGKAHAGWPRAQVLFHVSGRDWGSLEDEDNLPCVSVHAFREMKEVRGDCRLKGPLGICVASLELPVGWFPPSGRPRRGRRGGFPGANQEVSLLLYYRSLPPSECGRGGMAESRDAGREGLEPLGRLVLLGLPAERVARLDANVLLRLPERSLRPGETVGVAVAIMANVSLDAVVIRAKLKKGVRILSVHPSLPEVWSVALQHSHGSKHRIATVTCTRSHASKGWSPGSDSLDIAWLELEMEEFVGEAVTRRIAWQVEYVGPAAILDPDRIVTELMVTQRDVQGLVPLATEQEILNTAVLTGRLVTVPIKAVTVDGSGLVTDVTEFVECASEDSGIVKVSEGCDYVYVDGKETGGRQSIRVDLSYERLSATLHLAAWAPQLPLRVELSDSQLSQVKGWRVPIQSENSPAGDTEGKDEEEVGESKGRGCSLRYQQATLWVLSHFAAAPTPASGGPTEHMLGAGWQVDVTEMVAPLVRVRDPGVARVKEGRTLVGLKPGVTAVQVLSPVSGSILGQQTVTIADDKVTITDMDVQLVTGIRLALRPTRQHPQVIIATATAQESFHTPKQEGVLSLWLRYSDGTTSPLQRHSSEDYSLTVRSLDEHVVSVRGQGAAAEPVAVVAEGGGSGQLLQVKMAVPTVCQKAKRKSGLVLASAQAGVDVHFEREEEEEDGSRQAEAEGTWIFPDWEHHDTRISEREEGAVRVESTTRRLHPERRGGKWAPRDSVLAALDPRLRDHPPKTEAPTPPDPLPGFGGEEFSLTFKGVTDLEIGMYALLGIFCLAILVFFINCVTFVLKYRRKELPRAEPGLPPHWVWSGSERHGPAQQVDISPHRREQAFSLRAGCHGNGASIEGGSEQPGDSLISRTNLQGFIEGVSLSNQQGLTQGVSLSNQQGLTEGVSLSNQQGLTQGVSLANEQEFTEGVSLANQQGSIEGVSRANLQGFDEGFSLPNVQGFHEGVTLDNPQGFAEGVSMANTQGFTDTVSLANAQGFNEGVFLANAQGFTQGVSLASAQGFTQGVSLANAQGFTQGVSLASAQGFTQGVSLASAQGFTDRVSEPDTGRCPDGVSRPDPGGRLTGPNLQKQGAPGQRRALAGESRAGGGWLHQTGQAGRTALQGGGSGPVDDMRGAGTRGTARRRGASPRPGGGGEGSWVPRARGQGFMDGYCTIQGFSRRQRQEFRPGTLQDFRPKRVQLSTFVTAAPGKPVQPPLPATQSIIVADEEDIRWVCQDMGLQDPDELRSYMERIREAS
ncbi:transmembrane protein 132C-like isoform X2 [Scyliorhinus canicula]|uniref:transmembrane protein 132C-like isoform X2 n=1 Tax=Scyliorhinus canicula TaxID=7830 RepID=UPI0018F48241|nr:transmembrane protein 132C-like isoform X2 [Scyliorhinus canicula]